jgi:hypothetical protein
MVVNRIQSFTKIIPKLATGFLPRLILPGMKHDNFYPILTKLVGQVRKWPATSLYRVCGKKFFGGGRVWGVGCGVWGFTSFEVANYLIFREKVPKFPPDHSQTQYFLIDKRSKSLTQQGF